MKQSLDERNKMIGSAIQLLHGLALATFSAEAARVSFGWGTIGATLAWVFGGVVSCIPGVRSVLVFLTVKCMAPWWAALIAVAVFGLEFSSAWRKHSRQKPTTQTFFLRFPVINLIIVIMTHATATRIDSATEARLAKASRALRLKPADILRIGLIRVLEEFESTGRLSLGVSSSKPARRKKGATV